jgi:hypothetical protein
VAFDEDYDESGFFGERSASLRHLLAWVKSRRARRPHARALRSSDEGERARAAEALIELGLDHNARLVLEHVANEGSDQVLAAIARAVADDPPRPAPAQPETQLRAWALGEIIRQHLDRREIPAASDGEEVPERDDTRERDQAPEIPATHP